MKTDVTKAISGQTEASPKAGTRSIKRSLLSLMDIDSTEFMQIVQGGIHIKQNPREYEKCLAGKNAALLFQKTSTRTRVSFEFGVREMGGNAVYIDWKTSNFVLASIADEAKALSTYCDLIVARLNSQSDLIAMEANCDVPVINGMTDQYHPCQALADFMTIQEEFGRISNLTIAYIGDGNNVCQSLINAAGLAGANIVVCTPAEYALPQAVVDAALTRGVKLDITASPTQAVKHADVVYTDTWVSIGQEQEREARMAAFRSFQINEDLLSHAQKPVKFMHCLPAHRGDEVVDAVLDSPNSIVFTQAENRKHAQKALMHALLTSDSGSMVSVA